ncbi:MAG TPA: ATP-dependent DNA ligase, partial [Candidatus Binatus sp.]|nr:ATP-dependent DNA ligase [Candidatus Binatus sp.]
AHASSDTVKLFSRRLENITDQFPDIQEFVAKGGRSKEFIIEGEAVPINLETGELLPFQLISQRRGRKYELERMIEEIPISFFAFDVLYVDGVDYTSKPYPERRSELSRLIRIQRERLTLAHQLVTKTGAEMEGFLQHAIEDGCEGIVAKSLKPDSVYKAGARGWTWIKYKRDYRSEMQDTVDLTVVGAFAGRGRRGGKYGALLMAAYEKKDDVFRTVTKLGSGFKDEDLEKLPRLLDPYRTPHKHPRVDSRLEADVWFVPQVVLEIAGSEITLSPIHTAAWGIVRKDAGLAIRFPRFTSKYRDDKDPEQSTTTEELLEMYHRQLKKVKAEGTQAEKIATKRTSDG